MKTAYIIILFLIILSSCRSKYEALLINYNKTRERISKITEERKELQKQIPKLSDSISRLLIANSAWKRYYEQGEEVKNFKLEFYNEIINGKQEVNNNK